MDLLPIEEARSRLTRLQAWMQRDNADLVLVLQNADLAYFAGTIQTGLLCLPVAGEPLYLIQKSLSRARMESPWQRLMAITSLKPVPEILAAEAIGVPRRIGLEMDVLPVSYYKRFQSLFPAAEFVDASDAIRKIRMIKSPYEAEQMRRAALILDRTFQRIPEWLQIGASELEVMAQLEGHMRELGHQGITRMRAFNGEIAYGTVSSGPSACYPTGFPGPVGAVGLYPVIPNGGSHRQLSSGDLVMVDVVGGYNGYIADVTRTFALKKLASDMQQAHDFALHLMREIESMLKPGTPCELIYATVMSRVEDSPYADKFMGCGDSRVRFVGHGLGLELDEFPVLASGIDLPLENGMTIAVEPKIFFPERGGVGIENTYLITATGCENLTPLKEEILVVES
jgi:Xaa-Pro dipeptidase